MSPSNINGPNSNTPVNDNNNYIQHQVSKMDTLVGVAIKYGVEVADIKRLNGLATDLQMFALKTILIPSPGRHPPSPVLSSGSASSTCGRESCSDKTPSRPGRSNLLDSFESLRLKSSKPDVSPAMSTLQKYYGLKSTNKNTAEGTEMAVYRTSSLDNLTEELLPKVSSTSGKASCKNKYTNLGSTFFPENGESTDYVPLSDSGDAEGDKPSEKSVRRRQKIEVDSRVGTTERLLKEENGGGNSGFSPVTGKSLAMRPKSASRTALASDLEQGWGSSFPVGLGDSLIVDEMAVVRKSSSTSSLQDQDNSSSSSVWPTSKWSLKPDLQALSAASIFDSLPKPMSRKSKAALD